MRRQTNDILENTTREWDPLTGNHLVASAGATTVVTAIGNGRGYRNNNDGGGGGDDDDANRLYYGATGGGEQNSNNDVEEEKRSSYSASVISIVCNVIGAAILALPTSFAQCSLLVGVLALLGLTCLTFFNITLIIRCLDYASEFEYGKLIRKTFKDSPIILNIILISLFIFPFAVLPVYFRVIVDSMVPLMNTFGVTGFVATDAFWVLVSSVIFFILTSRRHLTELVISSLFGIITIMFLILVVIIRFFDGTYSEKTKGEVSIPPDFEFADLNIQLFTMLPVALASLSVHNNAGAYIKESVDRTPAFMTSVFRTAHVIIIISYLLMAVFGLLLFGPGKLKHSAGDVLDAFPDDDTLVNIARACMFIHFLAVFPLLAHAARRGLNNFIFRSSNVAALRTGGGEISTTILVVESFFLVVVSGVVGYFVKNIDELLSFCGSVFGCVVVLMTPSLLFLRLVEPRFDEDLTFSRAGAKFSIVFGFVMMVLGVYSSTLAILEEDDHHLHTNSSMNVTNST